MKRIDIYTIDIGGGHIAPAQALKEQFDLLRYDDLEVRVVNLAVELKARFLRAIYKFYWNNALRYPPLINAFYRGVDNPVGMKVIDRLMSIMLLPRLVRYLQKERPDLALSTYFTFTHYLELLKRVGELEAIAVVLNPEPFDSHYIWFSHAFDWSLVFSRKSRDEIVAKGLSPRRVKVFPFPIKPSFQQRVESKADLRARLGLEPHRFTLLFFFGAEGVGPLKQYLAPLIEARLDLQIVVVCGKNQKLRADMDHLAAEQRGPTGVRVFGFVRNLADFIAAADLVVGKSGPNQVFETLLQRRPIVITSFLANEKQTTDWVIQNKVGWLARRPENLLRLVQKVSAHPGILREYEDNIRALDLRSGAPEICAFLYGLLRLPS